MVDIGLLLAPAPAIAIGVLVMRGAGLPPGTWLSNVAAALLGVLVAGAALARRRGATPGRGSLRWALPVGLALLGTTLLVPGTEGVHRWLPLGPLRLHAGALVLPPLLVVLGGAPWVMSVVAAFTALLVLLLQPDAAQAASFCAGWIALAAARRERAAPGVMLAGVAIAVASLFRLDPLGPVPHVEGILGMAATQGSVMAAGGLLSLAALPLAFMLCLERPVGFALAAYTAGTLCAAWLGNYPVPMLGYGVSPILGYYFAVAAGAAPQSPRVPPPERCS
ncbi:MAG: hypothetical protein ACYC6F_12365 [Longimicrobiales bacterium]